MGERRIEDDDVRGGEGRVSAHGLDLRRYMPAYLTWIANKWSRSASALYRRQFGVGVVEWRLMSLIAVEPWIPASRICEVIGMDKAGVSRSVQFMQSRGLVETRFRDNHQRRQFIAVTPAGIALHDCIVVVARRREQRLLTGFTAEERRTALALLARMHENLALLGPEGDDGDI